MIDEPVELTTFWIHGEWCALLVEDDEGTLYRHQAGCVSCAGPEARGYLLPLPYDTRPNRTLCYEGNYGHLPEYDAGTVHKVIASAGLGTVLESRPDGQTAMEAWVEVRIRNDVRLMEDGEEPQGRDAILVWPNCD